MPTIQVKKEKLEAPKQPPPGIYSVRLDGFTPAFSEKKTSINLNPDMRIINNPEFHDRQAREWLNANATRTILDFCHCFGEQLVTDPANPNGNPLMPGNFGLGEEPDPAKWQKYQGPLLGQIGQVELAENTGNDGKTYTNVKRFLCRVPGCTVRHSDNLFYRRTKQ